LTEIREYLWSKYVDLDDPEVSYLEDEILAIIEAYYEDVPLESDKECFYYGILLFERGWEVEERREEYFYKAKKIFYLYRELSGETDWEPVEDRIEDIEGYFEQEKLVFADLEEKYGDVRSEPPEVTRLREACPTGMTLVPGGEYNVGPNGETVTIEGFYIDILPVTNEEFNRFIAMTKYRAPKYWNDERFNRPAQPTVGVSLFDALKYAQWAGKELPTVEQWMAAAMGHEHNAFPWGDEFDGSIVSWKGTDESEGLLDSGSFPENSSPEGCLDMAGNVWEWTTTWRNEEREFRFIKGGSFVDPPAFLKNDASLWASSKEKIDILGFRCCKPVKGVR
jgi:formylglycine-generating enzyme required for sulfatase activity